MHRQIFLRMIGYWRGERTSIERYFHSDAYFIMNREFCFKLLVEGVCGRGMWLQCEPKNLNSVQSRNRTGKLNEQILTES